MDKHRVYAKTELGRQALSSRHAGLGPRLRSLLIMVDGQRSVAAFDELLGTPAAPLLAQLAEQGWVVADAGSPAEAPPAAAPAVTPPVPGEPAAPAQDALPLAEARRLVSRFLNDRLGPLGETLALRVEACKTPAELQALLPRVRDALLNIRNAATLAQFDREVRPRLP
jgi:hypothetical protein